MLKSRLVPATGTIEGTRLLSASTINARHPCPLTLPHSPGDNLDAVRSAAIVTVLALQDWMSSPVLYRNEQVARNALQNYASNNSLPEDNLTSYAVSRSLVWRRAHVLVTTVDCMLQIYCP